MSFQDGVRALALDPGTQVMGFSVVIDDTIKTSGRIIAHPGMIRTRVNALCFEVRELLQRHKINQVFLENTSMHSGKYQAANDALATIKTMLLSEIRQWGCPYYQIQPTTIKKLFTGYGKATKEMMISRVTFLRGKPPEDDNHADAWAIGWCVLHYGNELRMTRKQKAMGVRNSMKQMRIL